MHLPIPTPPRNTDNGCNTQQVEPSTKKDREKVVSPAHFENCNIRFTNNDPLGIFGWI